MSMPDQSHFIAYFEKFSSWDLLKFFRIQGYSNDYGMICKQPIWLNQKSWNLELKNVTVNILFIDYIKNTTFIFWYIHMGVVIIFSSIHLCTIKIDNLVTGKMDRLLKVEILLSK